MGPHLLSSFALVVCQHPEDKNKFLVVQEVSGRRDMREGKKFFNEIYVCMS